MHYESILLSIEVDQARTLISERVLGISARKVDGTIEYESQTGYHLADLTETTLPNGKSGAQLRYRAVMISPTAAYARQKAREIRDAVVSYQY